MHRAFTLAATGLGAWWLYRTLSRPSYSFRGRNAFVTGGSRGLGLVLARELLARGAHVAVCARDAEELELAHADLRGRGSVGKRDAGPEIGAQRRVRTPDVAPSAAARH